MKTFATFINIIAFSALFFAYTNVGTIERPTGVRRALQTYASQLSIGSYPTLQPVWQIGRMQAIWFKEPV